jgi:iron complex outermembrane recepter protein
MIQIRHRDALATLAVIVSATAYAQRAEENAITTASDAFGTAIGAQSVGLYSQTDARGFSPQQAGNLRIEGLYFDQQTYATNPCMVRETAMRIGIAAQTYSFPSPTGIADFSLRSPTDSRSFSGSNSRGPFAGFAVQAEEQLPVTGRSLAVDLCGGYSHNANWDADRRDSAEYVGATWRWRPTARLEIVPFCSYFAGHAQEQLPAVFTDSTMPLPMFRSVDLATQSWANQSVHMTTIGSVVKAALSESLQLTAGLFHSLEDDPAGVTPFVQLHPGNTADFIFDASPPLKGRSTSGELQLTRTSVVGPHRHQLKFTMRGRDVERSYGGDAIIDFGNSALFDHTIHAEPPIVLGPLSHDGKRQLDMGATYEEYWTGVGSASVGLLRSNYKRTTATPDAPTGSASNTPWLVNARLAGEASSHLIFYGSLSQGLEDAALAPISAVNRGQPPAASRTRQLDGGVRWAWNDSVSLIVGVFDIHKPYLNTDASGTYRSLGTLRSRGFETSLSFKRDGFTLLAGGVLLRPEVALDASHSGATGSTPIGPVPVTLNLNMDYGPAQWGPWAASLQLNHLSSRYETTDDQHRLPSLTTIAAATRYKWVRDQRSWTLRVDGFNLTNAKGLHVSSLGSVVPEQDRRVAVSFGIDL